MSIRDLLPWQSLTTTKGDSRTTPQPSNQGLHVGHTHGWEPGISRRRFIHTAAAGATALAFGSGISSKALARDDHIGHDEPLPEPKPIPGGVDLSELGLKPPYDFIHELLPGPKGVVLPFTGAQLAGLNVEPSSQAPSPTSKALLPWHTMPARRRVATGRRTTSRPTSGSWRDATSAWRGRGGRAPSSRYDLTCSSSVRARRFTITTPASLRRGSSGPSSFPTVPST